MKYRKKTLVFYPLSLYEFVEYFSFVELLLFYLSIVEIYNLENQILFGFSRFIFLKTSKNQLSFFFLVNSLMQNKKKL